jgi:hypothetical protein
MIGKTMADYLGKSLEAGPEQVLYAKILEKAMLLGLAVLLITYLIYVLGLVKPYLPLRDVPSYWSLSVENYLHKANIEPGWAWLGMVRYADFLNFLGVVILAATSIVCFLAIVPLLVKNGDKVYAILAIVEVIILCVAASGILGTGGH